MLFDNAIDEAAHASGVVSDGGNYLSVAYDGKTTDIAYFDDAIGSLRIRPALSPGS